MLRYVGETEMWIGVLVRDELLFLVILLERAVRIT